MSPFESAAASRGPAPEMWLSDDTPSGPPSRLGHASSGDQPPPLPPKDRGTPQVHLFK